MGAFVGRHRPRDHNGITMRWNSLLQRIRAVIFQDRWENDLNDELRSHLEFQAQKHMAAGMEERERLGCLRRRNSEASNEPKTSVAMQTVGVRSTLSGGT